MGTKLRVANLSSDVDSNILEDMFSLIGDVITAIVQADPKRGAGYNVGYVEMSTPEAAQDSIDHYHMQNKFGRTIIVQEDKPHVPIITKLKAVKLGTRVKKTAQAAFRKTSRINT